MLELIHINTDYSSRPASKFAPKYRVRWRPYSESRKWRCNPLRHVHIGRKHGSCWLNSFIGEALGLMEWVIPALVLDRWHLIILQLKRSFSDKQGDTFCVVFILSIERRTPNWIGLFWRVKKNKKLDTYPDDVWNFVGNGCKTERIEYDRNVTW